MSLNRSTYLEHPTGWKTWQKRRSTRRTLCLLLALTTLCGFGYGFTEYLRDNQGFQVRRIRVAGTERVPVKDIIALSGVTQADNLLYLDPTEVRRRVLKDPYIKDCSIRRFLPDTLEIMVTERKPVATLVVHNRLFIISEDAVVLEEIPNNSEHVGVLITDIPEIGVLERGQQVARMELRAALEVLAAFSKTAYSSTVTISEISARHVNDIRLYCDDVPFEIRWGRGDFERQARRLDALWKYLNHSFDFKEYCDLRFGQDIACR